MKMVLKGIRNLEIHPDAGSNKHPKPGFKKVSILKCAICRTDAKMWEQGHRDLIFPRVLGHEMVVEDDKHQRYIVWPGKSCGSCKFCNTGRENLCEDMKITGFHTDGGFASSAILANESLIPIDTDFDLNTACFAEPVGCVINAFEKLSYHLSDRILIIGGGTMGLITALYAKHLGLNPFIIEKNETKIKHIQPFLSAINISCEKETHESEFKIVINTCADYIAFCQGITKIDKAGQISFFSGITKNEHIETNLLNLLHYKETTLTGVYGMTRAHMTKAIPFMETHANTLGLLIQDVVSPFDVPGLMQHVLSGKHLKYIIDMGLAPSILDKSMAPAVKETSVVINTLPEDSLCRIVIEAIEPLSETLLAQARAKIDDKTKPLGALGRMESLAVQMSLIQNNLNPHIRQKNLFVFAGDHGITEEGVSAYPSEVTAQMVDNFLNGGAAINVLCRHHGIDLKVVDMGVKGEFIDHPDLLNKKVAHGTKNFALENAMSKEEMIQAIENGMSVFLQTREDSLNNNNIPVDIVGMGEMGIGNTTCASAIISTITGIPPAQATGRGTGVDDKGLSHKTEVIERALDFHAIDPLNGFEILQKIGGFEIAGIVGAVLAAASKKTAIVLDGVISTAAGLVAYTINPQIKEYLISGHKSVEKAQEAALSHIGIEPLIDFNMRLGEGTGAALAIGMAETACKIMCEMASFDEAKVARSSIKA